MRFHYKCDPWQWVTPERDENGEETGELDYSEFALYYGAMNFHLKMERKINTQLQLKM